MNKLLLLALTITLASTPTYGQRTSQSQAPTPRPGQSRAAAPQPNREQVAVATYDQTTRKVVNVEKGLLKSEFDDGMKISQVRVEKQGDRFYLLLEGSDETWRRISRVPLDDDGRGNLRVGGQAVTETCTGRNCQHCTFAPGGGCACEESSPTTVGAPAGICEHTTSKSSVRKVDANNPGTQSKGAAKDAGKVLKQGGP